MGYLGVLRPASGTIASAAALLICVLCEGDAVVLTGIAVLTLVVGLVIAAPARTAFDSKDPGEFVLDEWCGMTVSVLFVPMSVWTYGAAFFIFRALDVWKPLGIGRLDRMEHPSGIMLDDVAAGLCANVFLQILVQLFPAVA